MALKGKRVEDSRAEQVQIVMPCDINGCGRLFGGRIAEWIDVVAAVVARRHSGRGVTTVCIDDLHFKAPAYAGDTVVLSGRITHVGNTSMEVRVDTYAENLKGGRALINTAFVTAVALDENEKPTVVPPLIIESDAQSEEWEAGEKRRGLRKRRRAENF